MKDDQKFFLDHRYNRGNRRVGSDPGPFYRADLLRDAKSSRGLGLREIADATQMSINTVKAAFDGKAVRIETLYILTVYFKLDWLVMFDTGHRLVTDDDGRPVDIQRITPEGDGPHIMTGNVNVVN